MTRRFFLASWLADQANTGLDELDATRKGQATVISGSFDAVNFRAVIRKRGSPFSLVARVLVQILLYQFGLLATVLAFESAPFGV
jgi:hypothetical protein